MVCFRRSKNHKDPLVRSKLKREEETVVGMFKCGKKKCKICDNVIIGATSLGPVYEFVCISFRTDNLNCFRAS
jgi:hypothetical protein